MWKPLARGRMGAATESGFVLLAVIMIAGCDSGSRSPQFGISTESIERIVIAIHAPPAEYSSTDPAIVRNVLDTLMAASQHPNHKCSAVGTLSLRLKSGRRVEVELLRGHEPTAYEFRFQDVLYRVPRDRLSDALRPVGVARLPD